MLPQLPHTDVLSQVPLIDGVDIWNTSLRQHPLYNKLGGPGVYCFYDAATGQPVYIGSSCARSSMSSSAGLCERLRKYYAPSTRSGVGASVRRILDEKNRRQLLVKCWRATCASDAMKYEYDAIEKYRPPLNVNIGRPIQSLSEKKEAQKRSSKILRDNNHHRNAIMYTTENVNTDKFCPTCKTIKRRHDFGKNGGLKDGRHYVCKQCMKSVSRQKYLKYRAPQTRIAA